MELALGNGELSIAICDALGIDPKTCRGMTIWMYPGQPITVTVDRHVSDKESGDLAKLIRQEGFVVREPG